MIAAFLLAFQTIVAPVPGNAFQAFAIKTVQEQPFEWQPGRTAVFSFCAFWCDTWKNQLPRVDQARKSTQGLPVDFFTVSIDGRWTDKAKAASVGTMLADPGGLWSRGIGIDRVPYTMVVDPGGKVTWASYGTVRAPDLTQAIRGAIKPTEEGGVVYLTFDDFPSERLSDDLLDELRREDVKATFFCIGVNASRNPAVTRRAADEGHQLQIHAWSHDSKDPECARCAALLGTFGAKPNLYRAPGSEKICDLSGHPLDLSVVDPYDYQRPGAAELTRRILLQTHGGSVIQLHAGVSDTLDALPAIIGNLRKRGFSFKILFAASFASNR